ncbi:YHS domain-containing (seleno)protein [Halodurantibacterium flavum]|uniref:YHS domain-containing (Seleno)protein n=1 Tax=Halodurantibacterium flavum TaxID=1382802 RepID=A0ABW4S401_9RHOB
MSIPRPLFLLSALILALSFAICFGNAALAKSRTVSATDGVALAGYDPVAYFQDGQAMRGDPAHSLRWRGATWLFASAAHLSAFEANPMAFFPEFGGYCVTALAEGRAVPGNPEIWTMHEGKLYFSASQAERERMLSEPVRFLSAAAANWPAAARN